MPTYSYRCADCGHAFDIHQSFTDDTLTICPNCGGDLRKIFSPVGVAFTGSGFYRNDSRAKPAESSSSSGSSDSSSSSGSSPSSSPASPAPSTPATPSSPSSTPSPTKKD